MEGVRNYKTMTADLGTLGAGKAKQGTMQPFDFISKDSTSASAGPNTRPGERTHEGTERSEDPDMGDEAFPQYRDDGLGQNLELIRTYERLTNYIRIIAVLLLSLDVVVIIASCFMVITLLWLGLPTAQLVLWVGSSLTLCLPDVYAVTKIVNAAQSKNSANIHCGLLAAVILAIIYTIADVVFISLYLKSWTYTEATYKKVLNSNLNIAQVLLIFSTALRAIQQYVFLCLQVNLQRVLTRCRAEEYHSTPTPRPSV